MKPHPRLSSARSLRRRAYLAVVVGALGSACAPPPPAGLTPADIPRLEQEAQRAGAGADEMARLAAAYREAGRVDEARALLSRALEREPEHAPATLYLGLTLEDAGEYDQAMELYRRYLQVGESARLREEIERRMVLVRRAQLRAAAEEALAREGQLSTLPPQPRTVAVFPFSAAGASEELRPLSRALADMLSTDLAQTDRLVVLERAQVQTLLDEMALGESGLVEPESAARGGRLLRAERVVQGGIAGDQESLQLDAAVVRVVAPGETAPEMLSERDALDRFFELEKRLALEIYDAMGIQLTPAELARVNQRPTDNVQALLAYGLGLEAADAGNYQLAAQYFNQAAALDPGFTAAQERSEEAAQAAAAAEVSIQQLAQAAIEEIAPSFAEPDLTAVEVLVPAVVQRDPVAESLGQEGIGQSGTILRIILRRP